MKENILTPVEMNERNGRNTSVRYFLSRRVYEKDNKLIATPRLKMNWLYGCGEMYTTVEDMKN